jgi:hypothetical protein
LKETRPLWPPQRGVGLREPNLGKINPRVSLHYSLAICFAPSLADSFIFLTLTRLVVVFIFENFSFALFTPPLGDYQPQRSNTSVRKQNTTKTSGRLSRFGPTFGQLLAKYMKKAVPHNRPIKQTKSKGRPVQKPTKRTQRVAQPRSPCHPPPGIAWCVPFYPSPMCCPAHVWGGTAMNSYYWPNPFAYLGWGAPQVFAY